MAPSRSWEFSLFRRHFPANNAVKKTTPSVRALRLPNYFDTTRFSPHPPSLRLRRLSWWHVRTTVQIGARKALGGAQVFNAIFTDKHVGEGEKILSL